MLIPLVDTHAHYYFKAFDADQGSVIQQDMQHGVVGSIQIGCDEISSLCAIAMAQAHPHVYATVGLHPCDALHVGTQPREYKGYEDYQLRGKDYDTLFAVFDEMIRSNPQHVVGLGECGFDRYHDASDTLYQAQYESFLRHLTLADTHQLPIVIHSRNSTGELKEFMDEHMPRGKYKSVVHCFSEGADFAQYCTATLGTYIGVGGVATYPQAAQVRDAIAVTPIEKILTETDAPFLVPQAYKATHKRAESRMIDSVVALIADIKGMPTDECAQQLVHNAEVFYGVGFSS